MFEYLCYDFLIKGKSSEVVFWLLSQGWLKSSEVVFWLLSQGWLYIYQMYESRVPENQDFNMVF